MASTTIPKSSFYRKDREEAQRDFTTENTEKRRFYWDKVSREPLGCLALAAFTRPRRKAKAFWFFAAKTAKKRKGILPQRTLRKAKAFCFYSRKDCAKKERKGSINPLLNFNALIEINPFQGHSKKAKAFLRFSVNSSEH